MGGGQHRERARTAGPRGGKREGGRGRRPMTNCCITRAARGSLPGASAVTAARLPVTHTYTRQRRRTPSGRGFILAAQQPVGAHCGIRPAHARARRMPLIINLEFIIDLFISLIFRLWLALYGAGVPPKPSGQAEAEHVRSAPKTEWMSLRGLRPHEVACARPGRAVRLAPMNE